MDKKRISGVLAFSSVYLGYLMNDDAMYLLYIGAGFVGATSAGATAASGHDVVVYDINAERIAALSSYDRAQIEDCLYEEGLGDLIVHNRERVRFTAKKEEMESYLERVQAVFLCVPTPEIGETGESDLRFFKAALSDLSVALMRRGGGAQATPVTLVIKSTVPIDALTFAEDYLANVGVRNVGVVSNPEFLVEGKAVQGSLKPDRIVVGAKRAEDFALMRQVYWRFADSPTVSYIEVNPAEAAASKLLANFYLFNRLAICFDVIGRTCEAFPGVKFEQVRKVLTTDTRIGEWGFFDSLYAGGSCLSKDSRSLAHQLKLKDQDATLVEDTALANDRQLQVFMARAEKEAQISWSGKIVAILGLAFKRDTNDVRNAASVFIARELLQKNVAELRVFDPVAGEQFKNMFASETKLITASSEAEALLRADVVIITTDWPQFRGLGDVLLSTPARPLIMDGRRILQHRYLDLQQAGFTLIAVGSPMIKAAH